MSKVFHLFGQQMAAADPDESVWLSASAGTGKTQVLSARVLRLLLQDGVSPAQVLCLTFTKAGAAEMAVRVGEVLASWVRMPETELAKELGHIGAPYGKAAIARARTLFASVLDCPGGGLRIDTIHAFAQWLLAAFPEEAGLPSGTRAMEDRDRALLAREVLSALLLGAEEQGDHALLGALELLSLRLKSEDVEKYLLRCGAARDAWFGPGSWQQGDLAPQVHRLLGLAADASADGLAALCSDAAFDIESLRRCLLAYGEWNTKTGAKALEVIGDWLIGSPAQRFAEIDVLYKLLITGDGLVRERKPFAKIDPEAIDAAACVGDAIKAIQDQRVLLELAAWLTPALMLGRAFAHAWEEAKRREGLIDFDDQIRIAAALLNTRGLGDWIRYKLDRRFDHILIDEAQDTNAAQWQIIDALTGDFFAGEGQHGDLMRTIFVVGDYKQAIFGFQGTDPKEFDRARDYFDAEARQGGGELQQLALNRSFRSGPPVLAVVDRVVVIAWWSCVAF